MTVLDVLTYADAPNPGGIPPAWPAQIAERADDAPAPAAPWQRMSLAEYQAHIAAHQAEYDSWAAAQAPVLPVPSRIPRYWAKVALSQTASPSGTAGRTLLDDATAAANAAGGIAQLAFQEADAWGRYDQATLGLAQAIGLTTDAQIDTLFRLADQLYRAAQATG